MPKPVTNGSTKSTSSIKPVSDPLSSRIREIFQNSQGSGGVTMWVKKLKSLYEDCNSDEQRDYFFERFVFYLQLPLTFPERSKNVNRVLEVVSQFAASFLPKASESEEDNDDVEENGFEDLPYFFHSLFDWLLDHHEVSGSMARLRVCLMLNRLLKLMGENASIDDDLYQKIYDNMQERLKDKVAEIRSQAVTALQRLQDPKNQNCPIMRAFVFHMGSDPSPLVRKTVIKCIAGTKFTLPSVLRRTRDTEEGIRIAAYQFLANKIHVKSLTIAQREQVLKQGLFDRSESVRKFVEKDLVPAWLRHCKGNTTELLYALDVGNSSDEEIAEATLKALCKDIPARELLNNFNYLGEDKLIPVSKLTPETSIYWKSLAKQFFENDDQTHLELLLPELTIFCKYVRKFVIEMTREDPEDLTWVFITKQLIGIMEYFDFADEAGRSNLYSLLKDFLLSSKVIPSLVPLIFSVMVKVETNPQTRIQDIADIIAEIRDPIKDSVDDIFDKSDVEEEEEEKEGMEGNPESKKFNNEQEQRKRQIELAKMKVQMNVLKDDLDEAIQNKDFIRAQEIKLQMDELDVEKQKLQDELTEACAMASRPPPQEEAKKPNENGGGTEDEDETGSSNSQSQNPILVHKCLEMIHELMKDVKITTLNDTLKMLLSEFIVPSIRDLDFGIRESAVKALGVCAIRSLNDAKRHLLLLLQVAHLDVVTVRIAALAVINDLLLFHGLPAFTQNEDEKDEEEDLESVLTSSTSLTTDVHTQGRNLNQSLVKCGNSIVAILIRLLDDPDSDVSTKVAEGLCKLLASGAITSAKLFMRLILIWFNPLTDNDGKLCHILGTFFPLYASLSRANQDCIEEAFMVTLNCLSNAPPTSPLAAINMEDVAMFFIQLTREDILQNKSQNIVDSNVHDSLAETICNLVIDKPDSYRTKILIKSLNNLQITSTNFVKLRELKVLYTKMKSLIQDRQCLRSLKHFGSTLNLLLSKDPEKKETTAQNECNNKTTNCPQDEMSVDTTPRRRMLFSQGATFLEAGMENEKDNNTLAKSSSSSSSSSEDESPPRKREVDRKRSAEDDIVVVPSRRSRGNSSDEEVNKSSEESTENQSGIEKGSTTEEEEEETELTKAKKSSKVGQEVAKTRRSGRKKAENDEIGKKKLDKKAHSESEQSQDTEEEEEESTGEKTSQNAEKETGSRRKSGRKKTQNEETGRNKKAGRKSEQSQDSQSTEEEESTGELIKTSQNIGQETGSRRKSDRKKAENDGIGKKKLDKKTRRKENEQSQGSQSTEEEEEESSEELIKTSQNTGQETRRRSGRKKTQNEETGKKKLDKKTIEESLQDSSEEEEEESPQKPTKKNIKRIEELRTGSSRIRIIQNVETTVTRKTSRKRSSQETEEILPKLRKTRSESKSKIITPAKKSEDNDNKIKKGTKSTKKDEKGTNKILRKRRSALEGGPTSPVVGGKRNPSNKQQDVSSSPSSSSQESPARRSLRNKQLCDSPLGRSPRNKQLSDSPSSGRRSLRNKELSDSPVDETTTRRKESLQGSGGQRRNLEKEPSTPKNQKVRISGRLSSKKDEEEEDSKRRFRLSRSVTKKKK